MPAQILLVEDHDLMRPSMREYLDREEGLEVVAAVENAADAREALRQTNGDLDLVLIDVALPGQSGIELLRDLRTDHPDLRCLMLSGHAEESYVRAAKEAGARGYVVKGKPDVYPRAVKAVLDGKIYTSDAVAAMWNRAEEAA